MVLLRCSALQLSPRVTLAGFMPGLVWLAARLLVSCCQWLVSRCQLGEHCGGFAGHGGQENFSEGYFDNVVST